MEVPPCWSSMFYTAQPHKVGDAKLLRLPIWHSLETLNFLCPLTDEMAQACSSTSKGKLGTC